MDGKPDYSSNMFQNGLKVYPLKDRDKRPEMEFVDGSKQTFNTIHANDFDFYHELNDVIQREPVSFLDPELRGLFASIGIEKNKPFDPDAVAVGNATARAITFKTREKESSIFKLDIGSLDLLVAVTNG
ncbi:MAG: hypothetical protein ACK5M1_01315 [Xanthomarina gelatinilytica]|uniref:hypothetical protein n=1 Tax=Xanthomarina gelatinilytica TaxID=1137281 RepID=UPI003A85737A